MFLSFYLLKDEVFWPPSHLCLLRIRKCGVFFFLFFFLYFVSSFALMFCPSYVRLNWVSLLIDQASSSVEVVKSLDSEEEGLLCFATLWSWTCTLWLVMISLHLLYLFSAVRFLSFWSICITLSNTNWFKFNDPYLLLLVLHYDLSLILSVNGWTIASCRFSS